MAKPWNMKLLDSMKDPEAIMIKGEKLVAIKDKFPKAKFHYLVLPYENIDTIFDLTKRDIELVREMELMGQNVIELMGHKMQNYKIGFHAQPSMLR